MTDGGSISACEGTFYDPGGTGNYTPPPKGFIVGVGGESVYTYTICNKLYGKPITVTFNSFSLFANNCLGGYVESALTKDKLEIYDGSNTSAPKIGNKYEKNQSPGTVVGSSGCLTFKLILDQVGNGSACDENTGAPGWEATISTAPPTAGPIEGPDTIISGQQATYTQTGDSGGTWSFTGESGIAFMNGSGTLTGLAEGTINVTYTITECGGDMAIKQVKIVNPPLPNCTITGDTVVCEEKTIQLTPSSNNGTWTSNNTNVATVNSAGVVTGVAEGTAIISYSVNSICNVATHEVLVEKCQQDTLKAPEEENNAGVNELSPLENVSLFPNPTNNEVFVQFELNNNVKTIILLSDMSGRILEEREINATQGINEVSFDMQQYNVGVYTVILQSNGFKSVKRLIRN